MQQTLKVGDVEVHLEGQGTEIIVMVHGWPDTYRLWDAQVAALGDRFRCARFTLPGFDSRHARRAYSLAEVLAVYRQVIEQVSPGKPLILLVHDWGAVFGYRFFAQAPPTGQPADRRGHRRRRLAPTPEGTGPQGQADDGGVPAVAGPRLGVGSRAG